MNNKSAQDVSMGYKCYMPSSTLRIKRYREQHRRIDYFPAPDVIAIIEYHKANGSEPCLAGILDGLVRAGHKAVSGNGGGK